MNKNTVKWFENYDNALVSREINKIFVLEKGFCLHTSYESSVPFTCTILLMCFNDVNSLKQTLIHNQGNFVAVYNYRYYCCNIFIDFSTKYCYWHYLVRAYIKIV